MKLIELVLLDENDENAGLELISLVDKPAIENDFYFFSRQKLSQPEVGEEEGSFVERCVIGVLESGEAGDEATASAICTKRWKDSYEMQTDTTALPTFTDQTSSVKKGKLQTSRTKLEQMAALIPKSGKVEDWNEEATAALAYLALVAEGEKPLDYDVLFTYMGPGPERTFCDRYWLREFSLLEIAGMQLDNPGFGIAGTDDYDKFLWKGGVNCYHYWKATALSMVFSGGEIVKTTFNPADPEHVQMLEDDLSLYGYTVDDYLLAQRPMIDMKDGGRYQFSDQLTKSYSFSETADQRTIVSPVMIPEKKILRQDEETKEFYQVFFTAETIKKLSQKYFRDLKVNNSTEMHDSSKPVSWTMLESWIIEDPAHDKSFIYGFDQLPAGTWMTSFKIHDDDIWSKVKDGTFKGISLEGNFQEQLVHA